MRLFVAIELSEEIRAHLGRVVKLLAPQLAGVSWTRPANLHLTMKFLGETPDDRIMAVVEALRTLEHGGVMRLSPGEAECFPPRGPVRIVGMGVRGDTDALSDLAGRIDRVCHEEGYRLEGRRFVPHITLGRARDTLSGSARLAVGAAVARVAEAPQMVASEFVLMQSVLEARGAQYSVVARFTL